MSKKGKIKSDLFDLPNIGPKSVEIMTKAGITSISIFKKVGPEKTYEKCCQAAGYNLNRAFLYVLRAADWWLRNPDGTEHAKRWWWFKKPNE